MLASEEDLGGCLERCRRCYEGPTLVYDLARVRERAGAVREVGARYGCEFLFPVKSFAESRVLRFVAGLGLGFDASNAREVAAARLAMDAAGRSSTLSVTGPWFNGLPDEIDACLRGRRPSRVMVNFDSTDQLAALPLAPGVEYGLRIGLDLASDRERSPGNLLTRFGVDAGDVAGIKALARRVPISGFHCHIGRETNDHDVYRELADTLIGLARALGLELEYLNLGGGLRPDVEPRAVGELVADLRRRVPRRVRLLLEPGNWWFAGAGFAVGRVVGVKPMRDGALRATLDLSKDCHLRWAKPRVVAAGDGAQRVKVCFAGPTLYEGDVLGAFDMPTSNGAAPVCVGDTVVFAGVTGYAAGWNTSFNGVPQARVLLHGIDG